MSKKCLECGRAKEPPKDVYWCCDDFIGKKIFQHNWLPEFYFIPEKVKHHKVYGPLATGKFYKWPNVLPLDPHRRFPMSPHIWCYWEKPTKE